MKTDSFENENSFASMTLTALTLQTFVYVLTGQTQVQGFMEGICASDLHRFYEHRQRQTEIGNNLYKIIIIYIW